jgi:hypothetical protein
MILQHFLHKIYTRSYWYPYIFGLVLWLVLTEISLNNFEGPWLIVVGISGAFAILATQSLTEWARIVDAPEPTLSGFFLEWFIAQFIALTMISWFVLTCLRAIGNHPGFLLENWSMWIVISTLSILSTIINYFHLQVQGFLSGE